MANLGNRQAATIIQLCKAMVNDEVQIGFYYADLKKVARLLDLIGERMTEGTVSYNIADI